MSNNLQSLFNPSVSPFYITNTNMLIPTTSIYINLLSSYLELIYLVLVNPFIKLINLISSIVVLKGKEITLEIKNYFVENENNTEKFLVLFTIFKVIVFLYISYKQYQIYKRDFEKLQQEIQHLKKLERMRDNDLELLMRSKTQDFINYEKNIKQLEKQLKRFEKEMRMYA